MRKPQGWSVATVISVVSDCWILIYSIQFSYSASESQTVSNSYISPLNIYIYTVTSVVLCKHHRDRLKEPCDKPVTFTHPQDMCEPQTWEPHRWGWRGKRASAPLSTAPYLNEWAWKSSVDESSTLLKQPESHRNVSKANIWKIWVALFNTFAYFDCGPPLMSLLLVIRNNLVGHHHLKV